jgi:hypothetical protein
MRLAWSVRATVNCVVTAPAGVSADQLVGLINGDRVPDGRDSLGLLDDDPRLQRFAQLLAELLLLAQLRGADQVAGRQVRQHHGHCDVPVRPLTRLSGIEVEGPDDLAGPESFHNAGGESFGAIPLLQAFAVSWLLTTSLEMGTERNTSGSKETSHMPNGNR